MEPTLHSVSRISSRFAHLTLFILQAALALLFLYAGTTKFNPHGSYWIGIFARIGLGQWFRYFTGAIEIIGAVLMVMPRQAWRGALLLAAAMAGAFSLNGLILRNASVSGLDTILLLLLLLIAWGRRPRRS